MKKFLIVLIAATLLNNCKDQKPDAAAPEQTEKKNYFPVIDFLKGQIHYVDSLPVAILEIVTENNRSDSTFIKHDEFDRLAQSFILPDLQQNIFEKEFKENSFIDQTTQSATFNYISNDSKPALQRVDVLTTANESSSKVKSIFMQETLNKKDTIIVKKLYWQTNKRLQIATITQAPNLPKKIKQIQVIWDTGE